MSISIRNLVLLALICSLISTSQISVNLHSKSQLHQLRTHQVIERYLHLQNITDTTKFIDNLNRIIQKISDSVNPTIPSIIDTKDLETINFSKKMCQNLTSTQKTPVLDKIKTTQTKINAFSQNLTDYKVKNNTKNVQTYLSIIQTILNRDCTQLNQILIGKTPLQTNIATNQSWILGNIKLNDLVNEYINRANKYNNITNCNQQNPFFNGFQCIKCIEPTPIFNISSSKCTKCPDNSKYDQPTKACVSTGIAPIVNKPNLATGSSKVLLGANQTQADYDKYFNATGTQCPSISPFVINGNCSSCPTEKPYFSLETKNCTACPNETSYDASTHKCIQVTFKPNIAAGKSKVLLGNNQTQTDIDKYFNATGTQCPSTSPFVINRICSSCPTDKPYFNLETKNCDICSNGTVLDFSTHKCAQKTYKPNVSAGTSKILLANNQTQKDIDSYFNVTGEQCPTTSPFVISGTCAPCPTDKPYFSLETKNCVSCPNNSNYDVTTHKCIQKVYKPNAAVGTPKIVLGTNQTQKNIDEYFNVTGQQCPVSSPYVINGVCTPCPTDKPLFSLQSKTCTTCPFGLNFNPTTHQCVTAKPQATDVNVQSPNLKMNDNSTTDDWNNYVQVNKNKVLCPSDKPYWTGTQCISCPVYFNIITKKCDTCPEGLVLNPNSHKCQIGKPLQPKLINLFNILF